MKEVLEEIEKLNNIYAEMNRFIACREIMETIKEEDIQEKFMQQKEKVISVIELELRKYQEEKDIEQNVTEFSLLVELCNKIEEATLEDDKNMQNEILRLQYIYKSRNNKTLAEEIEDFSAEEVSKEFDIDNPLERLNMEFKQKENVINENKRDKIKEKNRRYGSKLQIICDAEKGLYLVQDKMKIHSIKSVNLDKEAKEQLTDEQYKGFRQEIKGFSKFNGGDKNIAYILYKYDIENDTEKFQRYLDVINSPLEDEKKEKLAIRIRANIVYDLRKLYDNKMDYTREERIQMLDIANKARRIGIAQTKKSLKVLVLEQLDRVIYNYNRHVILSLEKAKTQEPNGYKVDVENLDSDENVIFNTQITKSVKEIEDNSRQTNVNLHDEQAIRKRISEEYEKYKKEQEEQAREKEEKLRKYNENIERNKAYFEKQKQKNREASKWENGNIVSENKDEQEK